MSTSSVRFRPRQGGKTQDCPQLLVRCQLREFDGVAGVIVYRPLTAGLAVPYGQLPLEGAESAGDREVEAGLRGMGPERGEGGRYLSLQ